MLTIACSLSSVSQVGSQDRIIQEVNRYQHAVVAGSVHPLAKSEFDAGRVDGRMKIQGASLTFAQSPAQRAALQTLLREQQDRSSPNYHRWLTPEQYANRFGLSRSDLAKVTFWLQSEGLAMRGVSRSRTRISFDGTVAQIEAALGTEFHHYLINGEIHFANATQISVPAALEGMVLSAGNLSDLRAKPKNNVISKNRLSGLSPRYTDGVSGSHYLSPADFATIYNVNPLYGSGLDGSGQTIAVMGQTAIDTTDIDAFRGAANLPGRTSGNFQQVQVPNSGNPVISNADLTEADLDLEWAEALAPKVKLVYVFVGNAPNFDAFDALQDTIDNNRASVISISYGVCEPNLQSAEGTTGIALQQEVQQANAQGQTIIAASGDEGAADCDGKVASAIDGLAVDVPASIPEVTGVGGTEFVSDTSGNASTYWDFSNSAGGSSALSYIPETGWNDSMQNQELSASGGGFSTIFAKPAWQVGVNVPNDGQRDVPDIALSASPDHDPYLICTNQSVNQYCSSGFSDGNGNLRHTGGTSLGAPSFAGIVALINQRTQSRQGNINPTLYSLAASTPSAFHDITSGNNIVPCTLGTPDCPGSGAMGYAAGPGYDQATGLGSIDANALVNAWPAAYSISVSPTSLTIAAPGGQATSTISLNSTAGFSGTVNLACTAQSGVVGLACNISPATLSAGNANAVLTISTLASASASAVRPASRWGWLASGAALFAGVFMIEIPLLRRKRNGLNIVLLCAVIAAGIACGGSPSSPPVTNPPPPPPPPSGTPAGTYTIMITATGGGVSIPASVTATVQ